MISKRVRDGVRESVTEGVLQRSEYPLGFLVVALVAARQECGAPEPERADWLWPAALLGPAGPRARRLQRTKNFSISIEVNISISYILPSLSLFLSSLIALH